MNKRRKSLLGHAGRMGCDTLVAFEPENLFYMTGFWGEALAVLEKDGRTTVIAPELEAGRAKEEAHDCDVVVAERGDGLATMLARHIKKTKPCTDCQNYSTMTHLKKSVPGIRPDAGPFHAARLVKDESEIRLLRRASRIIDEMFALCAKSMHAGQRESELQSLLMSYAMGRGMFDTGYRSTLNPLIVAGGPNGALPHAQVTERKFRRKDLVVVDITLRYKGYVSDATRTFAIGAPPSLQARDAYETVRQSQKLGLRAAVTNARCSDVDLACRNFIERNGFGWYFIHSTGHGIGLEVHESPAISQRSQSMLAKNMAVTVEPGIYIPDRFGIRIEDSVIVRDRPAVMHKFTKELLAV